MATIWPQRKPPAWAGPPPGCPLCPRTAFLFLCSFLCSGQQETSSRGPGLSLPGVASGTPRTQPGVEPVLPQRGPSCAEGAWLQALPLPPQCPLHIRAHSRCSIGRVRLTSEWSPLPLPPPGPRPRAGQGTQLLSPPQTGLHRLQECTPASEWTVVYLAGFITHLGHQLQGQGATTHPLSVASPWVGQCGSADLRTH